MSLRGYFKAELTQLFEYWRVGIRLEENCCPYLSRRLHDLELLEDAPDSVELYAADLRLSSNIRLRIIPEPVFQKEIQNLSERILSKQDFQHHITP